MKTIMLGFLMLGFAVAALAVEPAELDARVRTLTAKFEAFQHRPDGGVPAENLRRAQGIILLDRTKAGFLFAYQGGSGVAMVKDARLGTWSPAAFLKANEASLGLQVGGEKNFYIILLMTPDATRTLLQPQFNFGGEASGTAGDTTAGVQGNVATQPSVLVYNDRSGLYGGVAVKGGSISPDNEANTIYYGQYVTMSDILFDHRVQPTEASVNLANKINWYSQPHQISQIFIK
ncbi:MAG TPA: lipid-binding SYLF domain-containing protein [Verrucomicrobiae bacterium]|nr:lipid-binding SYLF domain-containing protein [Verrucomicrobiae bacterium]